MAEILLIYLAAVNVITFIYFGSDKYKAKRGKWRVPESTLLLLSAIGGAVGAFIAMRLFRHKTKHIRFKILVPILAIIWIVIIIAIIKL